MSAVKQRRVAAGTGDPPAAAADAAGPPAATGGDAAGPPKPFLRGAIHHYAVFVSVGVGVLLVLDAQTRKAALGCVVYTLSTTCMFGASALYHRPNWGPKGRAVMRRVDHAAIFALIAGTNTPLALIALPPDQCTRLLTLVWSGAALGIVNCLFFSQAPKWLASALYVALGWAALPFLRQFHSVLSAPDVALIVGGGVAYSLGALVYAAKRPDPVPRIYGYHEIFHTLVTLAALAHFAAVYRVVNSPLGAT